MYGMRGKLRRLRVLIRTHWVQIGVVFVVVFTGGAVLTREMIVDLPSPDQLYLRTTAPSTRINDRQGRLLYEILDPHGGSHTPIALDKIPSACINATVAVEDASFYQHRGVDFAALARAIWINVQGGEILSGGSTITQQLARNLLLSPEERTQVTLRRKLREMVLAWRLTTTYSKDDILTLYVNESNYGNLAYGIQAAAQSYFAKNASDMDLAECSLLAGLPQAPAYYNPLENPGAAHERQRTVLDLMVKQGMITPEEADLAAIEELGFASTPFPIEAPHFVMLVRQQLEREFGREAIYTLGLQVTTTLDLDAQHAAEQAVQRRLAQLAETRRGLNPHNVNNAAIVVLDPNTGEVLALVGSPDYFDPRIDGAVNAAVTLRQPGSAIKPITYAAAFDPTQPEPLTAATMMVDVRTSFVTREGDPYVPRNYDRQWHGPVLLRQALASSYNLIATKVLDHVGIETMTGLARSMGITTFDDADRIGLAITLGGSEVRLLELTSAYGAFANGGMQVEPMMISRVADVDGHVLKAWDGGHGARVMDERTAYLISDILGDNMARAPAFGEGSALRLSRPSAAKTGTTTDWRDNWTIGYTPDLVVGVWAGNADNTPMVNISGVVGAAPIWNDVMKALLAHQPVRDFSEPDGMIHVEVCTDSGLPPAPPTRPVSFSVEGSLLAPQQATCAHTVEEVFITDTEPTSSDNWHWLIPVDTRNGLQASAGCPEEVVQWRRFTHYPVEAQDWVLWKSISQSPEGFSPLCSSQDVALSDGYTSLQQDVPHAPGAGDLSLIMISPDHGSQLRLSPELPEASQQLFVAARPAEGVVLSQVTLLVDGRPIAAVENPPYQTLWAATLGTHTFSARGKDMEGNLFVANNVIIDVVK